MFIPRSPIHRYIGQVCRGGRGAEGQWTHVCGQVCRGGHSLPLSLTIAFMRARPPLTTPQDYFLNAANWQWLSASAFFSQYFRVYSPIGFGEPVTLPLCTALHGQLCNKADNHI